MGRFHQVHRTAFTVVGCLFVVLGIIGYITPVMPGTIFFILALGCFRRGESRFEQRLLQNRTIGPVLRDWDEHGTIKPRTKVLAITLIWLAIGGSIYRAIQSAEPVYTPWVVGVLAAVAISLTVYLWTRPCALQSDSRQSYS